MPGRLGSYDLREIHRWRERDRLQKHRARDDSGDPDLDGTESEGLERYRMAKAQMAELELAKRRGEVIDAGVMRAVLGRIASRLRGAGEQIERRGQIEAQEILENALNEMDGELDTFFAELYAEEEDDDGNAEC